MTGTQPVEYLNRIRADKAAEMLRSDSESSAIEIGLSCGFNSYSYFSSIFKKYYGITPEKYRQSQMLW